MQLKQHCRHRRRRAEKARLSQVMPAAPHIHTPTATSRGRRPATTPARQCTTPAAVTRRELDIVAPRCRPAARGRTAAPWRCWLPASSQTRPPSVPLVSAEAELFLLDYFHLFHSNKIITRAARHDDQIYTWAIGFQGCKTASIMARQGSEPQEEFQRRSAPFSAASQHGLRLRRGIRARGRGGSRGARR